MVQTTKQEAWQDETGRMIPKKYITPYIRLKERTAGNMLKQAKTINSELARFKELMKVSCTEVYEKAKEEMNAQKLTKGNFTYFNFDRSIKIEVSISERIDFDDLTIQACKSKLDEFINDNLDSKQEFLKDLVMDAFSTTKGKLDAKKVMNLMRYRSKINNKLFQEALNLLEESIRRPDSKTYFRIWERQENGEYKLIDLNFSSL